MTKTDVEQLLHDVPVHTYYMSVIINEAHTRLQKVNASYEYKNIANYVLHHAELQSRVISKGVF